MPFYIKPFFQKPFKLFAIDADTGKPLDPNVRRKITYYEVKNGSNGGKKLVAHKSPSNATNKPEKAKAEDKPADAKPEEQKKDTGGSGRLKGPDVPFFAEEDEKLKALKGENTPWKQIAEEMQRAQHVLKNRWKEIGKQGGNNQGKKEDGGKKGNNNGNNKQQGGGKGQQDNNQNQNMGGKRDKNNDNKNANQNNKQEKKAASKVGDKTQDTSNNDTRFTMADWLTVQEDDMFSFGELRCLGALIATDPQMQWRRVAAKFFDLTGRRVHPDDVRDKFESMAAMK